MLMDMPAYNWGLSMEASDSHDDNEDMEVQ